MVQQTDRVISVPYAWMLVAIAFTSGCDRLWAQNDDRRIANLEQAAVTAQNRGDYAAAAQFWGELLRDFPQFGRRGEALHNSGLCQAKLGNYPLAAEQLRQAIADLDAEAVESLARAHLYLGFSQLEWGKQLAASDPAAARAQFQSAADVLGRLIEQYPKYVALHEALYFKGVAHENLEQPEEAIQVFARLVEMPQATFYLDGLFALGYAHEQLRHWDDARRMYARFIEECGDHAARDEVRFRAGEVAWQMAKAAEDRGDHQQQAALLVEATDLLAGVAAQRDFAMRDAALFRLAWMAFHAGSWQKASELFAAVTEIDGSALRSPAALLAGRAMLQAESWDEARRWLRRAVDAGDALSAEAAHWMAQLEIRCHQPAEALTVASAWIARADRQSPMYVELLMDRAEAAARMPQHHEQAVAYYLDVVQADPQHRLAPIALYQAAFSLLESGHLDRAVDLCRQFAGQYPQHDYLPDVQEVWADAALASHAYDEARRLYDELAVRDGHPKQMLWSVRRGVAAFFQKRWDDANATLEPLIARGLHEPNLLAEANYWLGCTRLEQQRYAAAIESFENAIGAAPQGARTSDASLFLTQALLAEKQLDRAEQVVQRLWRDFPQATQTAEATVRFAHHAPAESAVTWLQRVIEKFPGSPLGAPSLLHLGRRLHQLGKSDEALHALKKLVEEYPGDERVVAARFEMATILRSEKRFDEAHALLTQLNSDLPPEHPQRGEAQFELAVVEIAQQAYASAIERLAKLLPDATASSFRDRIHYEIAWAARDWEEQLRGGDAAERSTGEIARLSALAQEHFTAITRDHAASRFAADAWFQIGQYEYAAERYETAENAYRQSLTAPGGNDRLRERTWYKLGWTLFKTKSLAAAHQAFNQQLHEFPEGPLHIDGLFMISEILFAQKQYEQALAAYRVAKPAIDESAAIAPENRWFAALHAAQAANQLRDYRAALEFAQPLANDASAADSLRLDAWLEVGNAYLGLKEVPQAVEAWRKASADLGKTGVRASCLIGDALFAEKKFDEAIQQFKLVLYGYGGTERNPDLDPWKAFAAYETARCYHVQIDNAPPALKPALTQQSVEFFQYLVDHYPDSDLAGEARTQIERLRRHR